MPASRLHLLWQLIEHLGLSAGKTLGDDQLLDLIQQRFSQMNDLTATEARMVRSYLQLRLPLVRDIAQPVVFSASALEMGYNPRPSRTAFPLICSYESTLLLPDLPET